MCVTVKGGFKDSFAKAMFRVTNSFLCHFFIMMFSVVTILYCIFSLPWIPNNKLGCLRIIMVWLFTGKLNHWKTENFWVQVVGYKVIYWWLVGQAPAAGFKGKFKELACTRIFYLRNVRGKTLTHSTDGFLPYSLCSSSFFLLYLFCSDSVTQQIFQTTCKAQCGVIVFFSEWL